MTLVVGLNGVESIVMAADSRGLIGGGSSDILSKDDTHDKLFQITNHCAIGVGGLEGLGAYLMEQLRRKSPRDDVESVGQALLKVLRAQFEDSSSIPLLSFLLTGYSGDESKVYAMNSDCGFQPDLKLQGAGFVGVFTYALFLTHWLYKPRLRSADLVRLAAYLISETAREDPRVGGPIKMLEITARGTRKIEAAEIDRACVENDRHRETMGDLFFGKSPIGNGPGS